MGLGSDSWMHCLVAEVLLNSWSFGLCPSGSVRTAVEKASCGVHESLIVQELCESRGGRPGLSVLTSLLVSVDVKLY